MGTIGGSAKAETNYVRISNLLRTEILQGEIPPGTWLRMDAIAKKFGVSVQPVREALQQLEGEGLVEIIPNRGARVRELDRQRLIHNHEIGEALEGFAARRFSQEASGSDLRRLEKIQEQHDAAIAELDWPRVETSNFAFHVYINGHGGNEELVELVSRYYALTRTIQSTMGRPPSYAPRVLAEHHALLDAFRSHDADTAARIGSAHVRGGLEELLQMFDGASPAGSK
ncbi:MAG TPA: GntR family transcriptional regulator [Devosiaceae bacterium]|nr:GntR family transcriptional regulator [Devosiaceae bacterium]